jgi:hypothetical protein
MTKHTPSAFSLCVFIAAGAVASALLIGVFGTGAGATPAPVWVSEATICHAPG